MLAGDYCVCVLQETRVCFEAAALLTVRTAVTCGFLGGPGPR